jgi:hypothetical protein
MKQLIYANFSNFQLCWESLALLEFGAACGSLSNKAAPSVTYKKAHFLKRII